MSFNYQLDVGRNTLAFSRTGTRMNKLDFYFDPYPVSPLGRTFFADVTARF